MSGLKSVQQIEVATQGFIKIKTTNGSKYHLSTPDEKGYRRITKQTPTWEVVELRGIIYGIAVEHPAVLIGSLLKDDRWAIPAEVIKVGDYMVITGDDAQFTITGRITSLEIG